MIFVFAHSSCRLIHSALFPPISRVCMVFVHPEKIARTRSLTKPLNIQTKLSALHCKTDDFYLNNNGPSGKKFRKIFYFQIAT